MKRSEQERIQRAESLRSVCENEHYRAAIEAVRSRLTDEWQRSPPEKAEERERIYLSLKMLDAVCRTIAHHIESGETDRKRLQEITGRKGLLPFELW